MGLLGFMSSGFSQVTITLDPSCQRFLGTVSALDRTKYFSVHDTGNGAEESAFRNEYGVTGGRQFWGAFARAKQLTGQVGVYPANKSGNDAVRAVQKGYVSTHHPKDVFIDGMDVISAADWAAEYYKDYLANGESQEFVEVMNEPFVHAKDFYEGAWSGSENDRIKLQMSKLYNEVGKRIHNTPALANVKVIGYSSAWPSVELNDFGHWEENLKMFMDTAGENMYGFSTHLYDGINVEGQDNKRSGSNSEAILDLIENYSYIKWNKVKPHAITEYGAIESGYGDAYSKIASAQTLRAINNILFNLLERQDRLVSSIPFITGKATWHINEANNYQPYQAVLWIPTNIGEPTPAGWAYSPRIRFYDLWKNVQGDRVLIKSNHVDVQTQAFVNGNTLYVALNNLDEQDRTVTLPTQFNGQNIQSVRKRSLRVYSQNPLEYVDEEINGIPSEITLLKDETVVLVYTFNQPIAYTNSITAKSYYSTDYLKTIETNTPINYSFNNVDTGDGYAVLRMSISRKHDKTKQPIVKVNGVTVEVPNNWKGYDQANRDDFFGMIEIPVPSSVLSTNNTVSVTFPDAGGRISSLILNVEKYTNPVNVLSLETISSPCPDEHKGAIVIQTNGIDNYQATIKANGFEEVFEFSDDYTISNLAPSVYDVLITSKNNVSLQQEYQVVITEPTKIAVETLIDHRLQKLNINLSGAKEYQIQFNQQKITTQEQNISLDLVDEKNHLIVKTTNDCQGVIEKQIDLASRIFLASNLIDDQIEIHIPSATTTNEQATIELSNLYGAFVIKKEIKIIDGNLSIPVASLSKGIYVLKIKMLEDEFISKIIKQ